MPNQREIHYCEAPDEGSALLDWSCPLCGRTWRHAEGGWVKWTSSLGSPTSPKSPVGFKLRRPGAVLAAIAAGLAFVMVVVYLVIIRNQGNGVGVRVLLIASCIAAAGACAAAAAWWSIPQRRLLMMAVAAGGLISLGIIGMFSIGFPLFIGGVLATIGSARLASSIGRAGPSRLPAMAARVAGFLLPVAVLFTPLH